MQVRMPSEHERFRFKAWGDVLAKLATLGVTLPYSNSVEVLLRSVEAGGFCFPNALAIHPMEGCDGTADGRPDELTFRRYERFATGGAGLLWVEATAVVPEGRANPRQLWITPDNVSDFRKLRELITNTAHDALGADHNPVAVLQLTHSGRYSKPFGPAAPIIAHRSPVLDQRQGLTPDYPLITDEELDELPDYYVKAAKLAFQAGYDGVDIKSCHAYLINQLLAAHTREGRYGGSFENRTRLLMEVIRRIRAEVPDMSICSRLNVYDAQPYPYGFGMATDGSMEPDLSEPVRLINMMHDAGVSLINVAYGSPYYNPHVERPYDKAEAGGYTPAEHPLVCIATMIEIQREIAAKCPDVPTVATGFTWLRQFAPHVGAALLNDGDATLIGFGRQGFAYPDFPRDLMRDGQFDPHKVCVCCSGCTQIMRDGGRTGCAIRDHEVYGPILAECRK